MNDREREERAIWKLEQAGYRVRWQAGRELTSHLLQLSSEVAAVLQLNTNLRHLTLDIHRSGEVLR
jgi:hypothetical protein